MAIERRNEMKKLFIALVLAAGAFAAVASDCGEKAPWKVTFDKAAGLTGDTLAVIA